MKFLSTVIGWLWYISQYFYNAYIQVKSWYYPFGFLATPLYYLWRAFLQVRVGFITFSYWVDDVTYKIKNILSYSNIYSYFKTYFDYAVNAWNWVYYARSNVTNIINIWWATTYSSILVLVNDVKQWTLAQLYSLELSIANLLALWEEIRDKIPLLTEVISWFENWWANVLSPLTSWWNERLLDIQALFNSWMLDYSPFWEGWQDWKDKVIEFFTDPEEWLYKAIDRIFERFW